MSSLIILGHIRSEQQRFAEAEQIYTQIKTQFSLVLGPHPLRADLDTSLGHLYAKQGKFRQAEQHYQQAIAHLEPLYGPDTPRLSLPQAGLADVQRLALLNLPC
ncbi:tetratricopeptide repeat protein [Trichothermofontia sp.]